MSKGVAVISYGQIHAKSNSGTHISNELIRYVNNEYLTTKQQCLLNKNDFVFADTSEDIEGAGNCAFNDYEVPVFAGYHTVIARPVNLSYPKFYAYLFQSMNWKLQVQTVVNGVKVYSINRGILRGTSILIPPLLDQQSIVNFLDWQTSKINKFIKAKRKLIALLKEQKQNIINEAVTKGINPDAKMKDSGVAWLGEIPAHWETRRIKTITKILRGKFSFRPRNDPSLYDGIHPFIQTGDIARTGKYVTAYKQTLNEKGFLVSKEFPKGTLTMTIAANIGEVAILNYKACFPDSVIGFVPKSTIVDFLYYLFLAMKSELINAAPINTQGNLNVERVGNMMGILPPIEEQKSIVEYIEKETALIDKTIDRTEREIELIQEYRTRLVSDVVTGQIDVRSVEIPDFDSVEMEQDVEGDEGTEDELITESIEE